MEIKFISVHPIFSAPPNLLLGLSYVSHTLPTKPNYPYLHPYAAITLTPPPHVIVFAAIFEYCLNNILSAPHCVRRHITSAQNKVPLLLTAQPYALTIAY